LTVIVFLFFFYFIPQLDIPFCRLSRLSGGRGLFQSYVVKNNVPCQNDGQNVILISSVNLKRIKSW